MDGKVPARPASTHPADPAPPRGLETARRPGPPRPLRPRGTASRHDTGPIRELRLFGARRADGGAGRRTGVLSPAHRVAADLDGFLGDPMDEEAGPFSYKEIVEAEERDELPWGAVDAVRAWGFPKYLVPAGLGGRLTTLEDLVFVTRGISRRSVTVAVMYGSGLLAVNPVRLWGNGWQRTTVAAGVLNGDLSCFGVSEADHGSDV